MKKYLSTLGLIVLSMITCFATLSLPVAAEPAPPTVYESYTNANGNDIFYGPYWKGQTFTPQVSPTITKVSIPLVRSGSPSGDITVSIRETGASGYPVGNDLAAGRIPCSSITTLWSPIAWYSFDLGAGFPLAAGKTYAIVWKAPYATAASPMYFSMNTGGTYSRGRAIGSADGAHWVDLAAGAWDATYQDWGQPLVSPSPTPSPTPTPTPTPTPSPTLTPTPAQHLPLARLRHWR